MTEYAIEMCDITKKFQGIIANERIALQLKKGEIHALLGENGAGKSTLMSVLFGLYQPEEGIIKKDGKEVTISNPNDANDLGIGMVHQHFKLVPTFTVLQNIIMGVEETKHGLLKMNDAKKKVMDLSKRYGLEIDPDAVIEDITVGMQQRVEILKMLFRDNEILIFDEPTAVLTPKEIDKLMEIMLELSKEGKSILFISHKLKEVKAVSDRCTILRKGKYIGTVDTCTVSKEELSNMMVGRKVDLNLNKSESVIGKEVLNVEHLTLNSKASDKKILNDVSFSVNQGEVVCIAGIDGNGQSELIKSITGLLPIESGKVSLNGEAMSQKSIRYRNTHGIGHIPEDHHKDGLVLDYSVAYNLVLQSYFTKQFNENGFLKFKDIDGYAQKLIDQYDIRSGNGEKTIVRSMSGGNQQKVIIAREIDRNPDLLIAVQPTRGLDIGAIEYIHRKIIEERDANKAILLVSFELDEVLNLSDRIIVLYEGTIVANLKSSEVSMEELGLYMTGSKRKEGVS